MASKNIPVKFSAIQYYCHRSYVPSYYWVYILLEKWIASTVFRNDTSRVFMASDDYAFRRRFELTDMSENYDDIKASSLRFPFANYWPLNSGWKADTRPAANTAALVYSGIYVGNTKLRASAVIHSIPVQFYFDREDDARLAYDKLFFYTYNEHYYSTEVPYGTDSRYPDGTKSTSGSTLALPVNIKLNDIQFNPSFKESDWLKRNRIFVIRANFDCRSYAIFPPNQPDYTQDIYSDNFDYDDGIVTYYPVEDVILNTLNYAWDVEVYNGGKDNFPENGNNYTIYVDSSYSDEQIKALDGNTELIKPSEKYYTWNMFSKDYDLCSDPLTLNILGYDTASMPTKAMSSAMSVRVSAPLEEGTVVVNKLAFDGDVITDENNYSGNIVWEVEDPNALEKVIVDINGTGEDREATGEELKSGTMKITDLLPNSTYRIYVTFISTKGSSVKLTLTFTTRKESEDTTKNSLVGLTW